MGWKNEACTLDQRGKGSKEARVQIQEVTTELFSSQQF